MKRWLFAILTSLAAGLCVVVGVLWGRSHDNVRLIRVFPHTIPNLPPESQGIVYFCFAINGQFWIIRGPREEMRHIDGDFDEASLFPGVRYTTRCYNRNTHMAWVSMWYPSAACCLATIYFFRKWWIHSSIERRGAGHCRRCGYDLRATPAKCPECGNVPREMGA